MFRESENDVQLSPQASKASSKTPSPDTQSSPDPQFPPDPRSTVDPDTYNRRHYESGYGTDYSPLSFGSPAQFTFSSEADDNVFELSQEIGDLQLEDPEFPFENEPNTDGDADGVDDAVGNDQEVETILSEGGEICSSRTVSDPIDIKPKRPRTPTPEFNGSYQSSNAESVSGYTNFTQGENERFTCSSRNNVESSLHQYGLHLSTSLRSVATQTPPSMRSEAAHCQCFHRPDELPVLFPRGNVIVISLVVRKPVKWLPTGPILVRLFSFSKLKSFYYRPGNKLTHLRDSNEYTT